MRDPDSGNNKEPNGKEAGSTRSFDGSGLGPGSQIGPFRIEQELGRGGAGVVYLAHDTKLDRSVAIKSLPPEVKDNPKALSRFTREAKVLASLNHPNIATIYDELEETEGFIYLVLEYVSGQTLAERTAKKPLKLEEALTIALQIAEAVAAAHEHDVIHRDLKPGNIKITPEGKVKVLDFGLAKVVGSEGMDQKTTITEPGRVIGTPAYMSPEQARGKPTDKRSDIWSFGCVLYEMLTATVPFKGETISDTLAGILDREPDWHALPQATQANIRILLRRCLEKDPRNRLQHIGDASIEISETLNPPKIASPTTLFSSSLSKSHNLRFSPVVLALLAMIAVVACLLAWNAIRPAPTEHPTIFRSVIIPRTKIAQEALWHVALAISPDGKRIAYVDESTGTERMLYVQDLDSSEARAIPGTEGAINPFFSADGLSLGYADHTRHSLEVVSLGGGVPKNLTKANHSLGAVWLDNGTIIFCPSWQNGLWSIPATGGTAKQLTALNIRKHETCHAWPCALPNNHILFTSFKIREGVWEGQLQVVPSSGGTPHLVLDDAQFGLYIPSGHLIFIRNDALHAICLDTRNFVAWGDAIPLSEDVLYNPVCAAAQMCCSSNGRFVFIPAPSRERSLVWVDDHGQSESLRAVSRRYESLSLSPDERYLAVSIETQQRNCDVHSDIWVYDTARSAPTQLTFDGLSTQPRWAVNSRRLIYLKHDRTQDKHDLCAVDVGDDKSEEILARVRRFFMLGYSVHPDGNSVIGTVQSPSGDQNIVLVDLRDDSDRERFLVDEAGLQRGPVFSPDGRWFVYSSHETGTWEVYVRPFPGPGQRIPVSKGGGYEPLWDPRGDKLYYRKGDEMWMVSYKVDDEFKPAEPKFLFKRHFHGGVLAAERTYTVGRDGRFLMIAEDHDIGTQINVVVNWFEELKRLVPIEEK